MKLTLSVLVRRTVQSVALCWVAIAFLLCLSPVAIAATASDAADAVEIMVYRDPSCHCCGRWMDHLREQGFEPRNIPTENMDAFKQQHGIPDELASCHTAVVNGYLIEGHVPAADIKQLLAEQTQVAGIAVPGMPIGTPGMESEEDSDPFTVFSFDNQGNVTALNEYSPE